jgi:hypothetical protein
MEEDMVSVRSEGDGTTVDAIDIVEAMDMVLDCGMLPWLVFLVLLPGGPFIGGGEPALWSTNEASVSPDSRRLLGMTLPLDV